MMAAYGVASSSSRGLASLRTAVNAFSRAAPRANERASSIQALREASSPSRAFRRSLHSLPALPKSLSEANGCDPLFSAQTIKLLWDDWHAGLLGKLNDEVRGTEWENSTIVETVVGTSMEPDRVLAFNYASLALNNSFFLNGLRPKQLPEHVSHWSYVAPPKPVGALADEIDKHFDSLPAFKLAFSSAAYGMAGSGYVWLVQDAQKNLGIVPTFGAGTLLVQNRQQRNQGDEQGSIQTANEDGSGARKGASAASSFSSGFGSSHARSGSSSSRFNVASERPGTHGEELYPILCVSVHERDWLPDFGMWGKEEYLMRFWECVDWERANALHLQYNSIV